MIKIKKEAVLVKPSQLEPSSKELEIIGTINPGVIRLPNGNIILYVRVIEKLIKDQDEKYVYSPRMIGEDKFRLTIDQFDKKLVQFKNPLDFVLNDDTKRLTYISHIKRIILDSGGFKIKLIDKKPSFYGLSWDGELGIEDPRIVKINNLYIMTYVTLSRETNVSTSIAISNDCKNWYRRGIIFEEQNKDVVIFPELINKNYLAFNRPEGSFEFSSPHLWMSYSKNLEDWGRSKPFILSEKGWDSGRVGAGPPPIKTKEGWLLIYHGVRERSAIDNSIIGRIKRLLGIKNKRLIYNAGAVLLDRKNPSKIIAKTKNPIIIPKLKYEKGTFEKKDVIFPTGLVLDKNNKDLLIYSGGGDVVTTVRKINLKEILKNLEPKNNEG